METNLDALYKTDKGHETEGIWMEISPDVGFRLKRFGGYNSPAIKKVMANYNKRFARQIDNGTLPEDVERKIYTKAFVKSTMTDWKGIEINGQLEDFTVDKAVEMLVGLPDLLEVLVTEASKAENYKEDLGNS